MKVRILRELPWAKVGEVWEWHDKALSARGPFFREVSTTIVAPREASWPHIWGDPFALGWIEEVKAERYKGGEYYLVWCDGDIMNYFHDSAMDDQRYNFGNYYRNFEDAEEAARRVKKAHMDWQEEILKREEK